MLDASRITPEQEQEMIDRLFADESKFQKLLADIQATTHGSSTKARQTFLDSLIQITVEIEKAIALCDNLLAAIRQDIKRLETPNADAMVKAARQVEQPTEKNISVGEHTDLDSGHDIAHDEMRHSSDDISSRGARRRNY